jgi:hypothetical protein
MAKSTRVAELLAITSHLISCMEREVELLRAMRPQDVKTLQADKIALADTYRAFAMALKDPGEDLGAVNQTLREELTEATERFEAAVHDNLRALRAMRDVNERVMRAIVGALEDKRAAVTGYDARGSLRKNRRAGTAEPASIQQRA